MITVIADSNHRNIAHVNDAKELRVSDSNICTHLKWVIGVLILQSILLFALVNHNV